MSTACRFWNTTTQQWSTAGVVAVGVTVTADGKRYLQCGATHLTAFMGLFVKSGVPIGVNTVNLVTDAGTLQVRTLCNRCRSAQARQMRFRGGCSYVEVAVVALIVFSAC